ncbi:MAG: hypothetical protein ACK4SZ_05225 [Allosphingosinicella sp.]|uniref:hypothetical protein n=1 Tax=Allosphingosinicella sp. TaxID=2823234 RepID=UPI00393E30A4
MKIVLLAAVALPLAGAAQTPDSQPQAEAPRAFPEPQRTARNMLQEPRPGCTPIVVQVAGEDREYRGTRLDQQPPAQLLYAVDREIDGCREVTFVHDEDRQRVQQGR